MQLSLGQLGLTAVLAVPVGLVSLTLAKAEVFEPLREAIDRKFGKRFPTAVKLLRCALCLSFWIAVPLAAVYRPRIVESAWAVADVLVSYLLLVGLAAPAAFLIFLFHSAIGAKG